MLSFMAVKTRKPLSSGPFPGPKERVVVADMQRRGDTGASDRGFTHASHNLAGSSPKHLRRKSGFTPLGQTAHPNIVF